MKILSAPQIKRADAFTVASEKILSVDLMERAAVAATDWIKLYFAKQQTFYVFCGHGNNGGDGIAISRLLIESGYSVKCYIVNHSNYSNDCSLNKTRLMQLYPKSITNISAIDEFPIIPAGTVIIDALLGIGIFGEPNGLYRDLILKLNTLQLPIVSIDVPSGLNCDDVTQHKSTIIKATHTLCFQLPKFSFLFPETHEFVGDWYILDIGLSAEFIEQEPCKQFYVNATFVKSLNKKRDKYSHKGTFGHGLLVSGSHGKIGASVLAAKSFLRSGAGLLTVMLPQCGYEIMQVAAPEAMTLVSGENEINVGDLNTSSYKVIAVGPGIGTSEQVQKSVLKLIQSVDAPLVLDADALNCISQNRHILEVIPKNSIITPHLKEFERLTEVANSDFHRHQLQKKFSVEHEVIVVLKGAHTCITTPSGESYFNSSGNSGLAKGGSGDILTGLIAGLLAQNYSPINAAIIGVYIHGLAADITKTKFNEITMLPSDVINNYSDAFKASGFLNE